jgi:gamma-glutamyltranspeptidase/glutathione hydrolase
MHTGRRLIVGLIAVGMGIAALAQPLLPAETDATNEQLPPQLQTSQVTSRYGIVVANTEEAAEAGARILRRGGNAVDAAVATAFALGVAEAEGSGLGGHAWILVRMADGRAVSVSGVAGVPVRADPARMVDLKRRGELVGHRVAVAPAGLAAMEAVRRRFGTMALPSLLEPAIELAITGTRITLHQQAVVETYHQRVLRSRLLTGIFLDADFAVRPSGDRVCQPRLARTLARLAQRGVSDFYRGALARAMIADMQRHGGFLTLADLALVRPSIDEPVRGRFRDYEVLSVPSPGGGGAVVEALQILDRYPPEILMTPGSDHLRIVTEAVRMALYDAYASLGDGGIDDARLADPTLAAVRARQIDEGGVTSVERILSTRAAPLAPRQGGTTHLSVVDGDGNAVSMTLSLNNEFGDGGTHDELGFAYNGALGFYDLDNPRSPALAAARAGLPHHRCADDTGARRATGDRGREPGQCTHHLGGGERRGQRRGSGHGRCGGGLGPEGAVGSRSPEPGDGGDGGAAYRRRSGGAAGVRLQRGLRPALPGPAHRPPGLRRRQPDRRGSRDRRGPRGGRSAPGRRRCDRR